jgi:hypothetical protein
MYRECSSPILATYTPATDVFCACTGSVRRQYWGLTPRPRLCFVHVPGVFFANTGDLHPGHGCVTSVHGLLLRATTSLTAVISNNTCFAKIEFPKLRSIKANVDC